MGNFNDRFNIAGEKVDLFFNELSIRNKECIEKDSIITIARVYKALRKYNITTCRIASEDNTKLFQMISSRPDSINIRNFYFSFFRSPYESEEVDGYQEEYYEYNWSYDNGSCMGFALAFLLNSASFSIDNENWGRPFVRFLRDEEGVNARNICTEEHVDIHIPQLQGEEEIELLECGIEIADKKIVLRNDHGMDELEEFSKRLIRCPYLIGVINSLPHNPNRRKFIKKIRENGLIEIVLPWTDKGYGIVVKTTGRTLRETEKIAEIIEEEFGRL